MVAILTESFIVAGKKRRKYDLFRSVGNGRISIVRQEVGNASSLETPLATHTRSTHLGACGEVGNL
jgi:hypothetical protein